MSSIKNLYFICSIIFLVFVQLGQQSGVEDNYESSAETPEDVGDITEINATESDGYIDRERTIPETTAEDITNLPSSPSTHSSTTTTKRPIKTRPTRTRTTTTKSVTGCTQTPTSVVPKDLCNNGGEYNGEYDVEVWPPVFAGEISEAECPDGAGKVFWKCLDGGKFDEDGPDFENCTFWLDELENLPDIQAIGEAIDLIEFISNKTEKTKALKDSEKLSKVLDIISKVQTFVDNAKDTDVDILENYAIKVLDSFTHLMDQKLAWDNSTADEKANLASKILIGTQSSSYSLSLQQNSTKKIVEILNKDFYINTFYVDSSHELKFPSEENRGNYSSIFIPPNTAFINSSVERNSTANGAIISNLNLFMSINLKEYEEINSDILGFSLANRTERIQLTNDVIITLKHKHRLQLGDKVECVFWDFNQSKWSSEGCHQLVNESDLLHTVCKCNHLTNFAALMDVQGRESKTLLKSLLTYFCSVLSIFGLIFTVNLIIRSKHNSQKDTVRGNLNEMRSIITCNLCICLMITNILVIAGMDRTDILWLCQMSSALLLYSLLSSFSWMLMEGYYLYKTLVAIFNAEYKPLYLYLLGYGLPIGIFIIAFICIYIKENILLEALFDERYNYFCWISSSHYPSHIWILIGPAVCVIVCNCILMYISLRTAFKILRNQSSFGMNTDKTKIKFRQIISFVFILFLLGITWLSFLFYIHQLFTAFFAYVFIVLNGSQGFFIFLYHLSIYDFKGNRRADSTHSSQSNLTGSQKI